MDTTTASPVLPTVLISLLAGPVLYFTFITLVATARSTHGPFWKVQSWVGIRDEWFSGLRAKIRVIKNLREIAITGYEEFSKKGRAFVMPLIGCDGWFVLPPSATKELLSKSDDEVDTKAIHYEQIHAKYTQGWKGLYIAENELHFDVVKRQLTRRLPQLTADVYDELRLGFEEYLGTDTENFKTVNLYPIAMKIVTRAANRVFAGKQICRTEAYLEHSRRYSMGVFAGAALIQIIPEVLRPILSPLVTFWNRKNEKICQDVAVPIVKDRLFHYQKKLSDPTYEWESPIDVLQWIIEDSFKTNKPKDRDPEIIAFRLLMVNMVAIHTTSASITNTILDLFSSPHSADFVAGIREECSQVMQQHGGQLPKYAVNELIRVDSAIRESMRFSDLGWLAINRMVTAPNGVAFLNNNIHVPAGIRICIASCAIHKDETNYSSPYEYNAFRFSAPREEHNATKLQLRQTQQQDSTTKDVVDSQRSLELMNTSLVTTTDKWLAFGQGRHGCPGRFFAAQEMKLMLAYLVMHYDVVPWEGRPENVVINGMSLPPEGAEMRYKRRRGVVGL